MRDRPARPGIEFGRRGISDVVGYILVFSLVVSVVGIVSVAGFTSLDGVRNAEQVNNAERAFDVLADNMRDVYAKGAPSRATEISLSEASLRTTGTVTINVTARNTTTDENFTVEKDAQPLVWSGNRDTNLVYSLGATIRQESDSGVVLETGPSRYDTDRAVVQIVQTRAEGRQYGGSTYRVRAVRPSVSTVVMVSEDADKYDNLWVNVTSPRADTWRRHLERYPDTDCSVVTLPGDETETATCKFSDRDSVYVTLTRIDVSVGG